MDPQEAPAGRHGTGVRDPSDGSGRDASGPVRCEAQDARVSRWGHPEDCTAKGEWEQR